MELPAVGAFPTVALLIQVVSVPSMLILAHPVGGKVGVVNPSVNGKVDPEFPTTVT
jgi:hypothetical protein